MCCEIWGGRPQTSWNRAFCLPCSAHAPPHSTSLPSVRVVVVAPAASSREAVAASSGSALPPPPRLSTRTVVAAGAPPVAAQPLLVPPAPITTPPAGPSGDSSQPSPDGSATGGHMTPQDRERARVVAAAAAAGVPLDHLLVFAPVFDAGTCGRNHTICFAAAWKHPSRALSQHIPRHSPM